MRIESVQADAFGPLSKASLTLAPGMQLIHGPNEAGKSSWHAALYAGLCGMPRGRGRGRKEDLEFRERHRPWDGAAWQVGTVIALADGRRVELRHDLDGRIDCSAQDVVLGRDYSSEIMCDGAPDGSRWLGLDRRSFLAIACVRQADLLGVLEKADLLKDYVQRAVDSLAQDASVASAIEIIEQFRRDQIGRDAASAVKPLRQAREHVQRAEQLLTDRQAAWADYARSIEAVDHLEDAAKGTAADLATQLAQPPVLPSGDLEPHATVQAAAQALELSILQVAAQEAQRPTILPVPNTGGAAPADLRELAGVLGMPRPTIDPALTERLLRAKGQVFPPGTRQRPKPSLIVAAILAIFGLAVALRGLPAIGGILLLAAVTIAVAPLLRRVGSLPARLREELRDAEFALRKAELPVEEYARRHEVARQRLGALGLAPDAATLVRLAGESEAAGQAQREWQRWSAVRAALQQEQRANAASLTETLSARGVAVEGDPVAAYAVYLVNCSQRRLAANEAGRRLDEARGQLTERRRTLGSIAEAEEALAAARSTLDHLLTLDHTLLLTQSFLERAQQSIHQSVAPVLASALRRRLPAITAGRYTDVRVDPESLAVQVLAPDGYWRHAALLSHGTAEQIYLLLRVALAQHLTRPGEVCPLILDDVTVHCDRERKCSVLETLHQISNERQVILFSQEEEVLAWAEEHLHGQDDCITRLA